MTSRWGTDVTRIRDMLRTRGHSKWGFIIYRCTYADDTAWARFIEILNARARHHLAHDDGLDLLDRLDWKVQDDRATLDGASVDRVRERFAAWLASDEARAEQRGQPGGPATMLDLSPRYTFCMHVDSAALDSVVRLAPAPPVADDEGTGYVNMVDAGSGMEPSEEATDGGAEEEEEEDEKMGWMRVCVDGLVPGVYAFLQAPGAYYVAYKRPPQVWVR